MEAWRGRGAKRGSSEQARGAGQCQELHRVLIYLIYLCGVHLGIEFFKLRMFLVLEVGIDERDGRILSALCVLRF